MPRTRRPSEEKTSNLTIKLEVDESLAQSLVGQNTRRQPICGGKLVLHSVPRCSTVRDIRTRIEDVYGLLWPTYRLHYLDDGELPDSTNLRREHISDGATLSLRLWSNWSSLIESCASGSPSDTNAVTNDICGQDGSDAWRKRRCWVAIFMACHLGHFELLCRLLESGYADINTQGPTSAACSLLGRTPLHAAAAGGQWRCLCLLLEKGAAVELTDRNGKTAQALALARGRRLCDRTLKFSAWNFQKAELREKDMERPEGREMKSVFSRLSSARQAHQFADSSLRTWLRGDLQRLYMAEVPNRSPLPRGGCAPASTLVIRSRCSSRLSASSSMLAERSRMSNLKTQSRMRVITPASNIRLPVKAWQAGEVKSCPVSNVVRNRDRAAPAAADSTAENGHDSTTDMQSAGSICEEESITDLTEEKDGTNPEEGNWRFSRYTCFDPERARYLLPSGWRLRSFSEQGLQRGMHIRRESLPRPQSLEPPKQQRSLTGEQDPGHNFFTKSHVSRSAPHLRGGAPASLTIQLLTTGRTAKPFN